MSRGSVRSTGGAVQASAITATVVVTGYLRRSHNQRGGTQVWAGLTRAARCGTERGHRGNHPPAGHLTGTPRSLLAHTARQVGHDVAVSRPGAACHKHLARRATVASGGPVALARVEVDLGRLRSSASRSAE